MSSKFVQQTSALREINIKLTQEINDRIVIESSLKKQTKELDARVRNLNCLYNISNLMMNPELTFDEVIQKIVQCIPFGWQHFESIYVKVIIEEREFTTKKFQVTPWKCTANIVVNNAQIGSVNVHYLNEIPCLKEDHALLAAIAEHLGHLIKSEKLKRHIEKSNEEMKYFIFAISHDLRSPLVAINGFFNLMSEDLTKANFRKYADRISINIMNMEKLLEDILSLACVGFVIKQNDNVFISELFKAIAMNFEKRLKNVNIALTINIVKDYQLINIDKQQIVQVLDNLIINAMKYMGEESKKRTITLSCDGRDDQTIGIYVQDTGMGIPSEEQRNIFEILQRVKNTAQVKGEGVGLAIVKKIVEQHEGKIWVESKTSEGSTFFIVLPLKRKVG